MKKLASWTVAVAVAITAAVAFPAAANADPTTAPVKQFSDQAQLGLGQGSDASFTIDAPAHNSTEQVVDSWKLTDVLRTAVFDRYTDLTDVQSVTVAVVDPASPATSYPIPLVNSDSDSGYRWELAGDTLSVWLTPTGLRDYVNFRENVQRDLQVLRVTVNTTIASVGYGFVDNTATIAWSTIEWTNSVDMVCPAGYLRAWSADNPNIMVCVDGNGDIDPNGQTPPSSVPGSEETNTARMGWGFPQIWKVNDETGAGLRGAKFEVYPAADPLAASCEATPAPGAAPIAITANGVTSTEFETGLGGRVEIPGLWVNYDYLAADPAMRCYVVKETVAPPGYVLPSGGAEYTAFPVYPGGVPAGGRNVTRVENSLPFSVKELSKQFTDQTQFTLGLGSEAQFTINAPAHNSTTQVVDSWKLTDVLDPRIDGVESVTADIIDPADPTNPIPVPLVTSDSASGYRWTLSGDTLTVWLTQTGLRDYVNLPELTQRESQMLRVTVNTSVSAVGDGTIENTSNLDYATTQWSFWGSCGANTVAAAHPDNPSVYACLFDPEMDPEEAPPWNPPTWDELLNYMGLDELPASVPASQSSNTATTRWGSFDAIKVDSETDATLSGAKFEVYPAADPYAATCEPTPITGSAPIAVAESGVTVTEFASDANGVVHIPGLFVDQDPLRSEYRCYVLKETAAPAGYDLSTGADAYTAIKVTPGAPNSDPAAVVKIHNTRTLTSVAPVAPTVNQATCPVPGKPTAPQVVPVVTAGVVYTVVGEVKAGNTVTVQARAAGGYQLVAADGWAIVDGVATFTLKLDAIDCEKLPASDLAVTGGMPLPPFVGWGAGVVFLLGTVLIVSEVRRRVVANR